MRHGDGGGGRDDVATALALDGAGNAWVTGWSAGAGSGRDLVLWKLDAQGELAAGFPIIRRGDAGGAGDDEGSGLVLDQGGNVWVTGYSSNAGGNSDMVLYRFDPAGALAPGFPRVRHGDGGGNGYDGGAALAIDAGGKIWVSGYTTSARGDTDFALWKFE